MPIFELQGPGGKSYEIDAPNMQSAMGAFSPQRKSGGMADLFKSIPGGMLGGLSNMLSASGRAASAEMAQPMDIPSGPETKSSLEQNITGKTYEPQGMPGQFGARIGESLVNPLSWIGPGGFAAKGAMAVGGALGAETGSQTAKGTAAEIPASILGGMLGGAGVGAAAGRFGRAAGAAIPTGDELRAASRGAYRSPEVTSLEIAPDSVRNLSARIENDLTTQGFRPRNAPGAFEETGNLNPGPGVASVRVADLDAARRALQRDAAEVNAAGRPTEAAAAARVTINHIDDYLTGLGPRDVIAGDAAAAQRALAEARGNWGAASRSAVVDRQVLKAETRAAAANSGQNVGNAVRQRMADVALNPALARGYSPEEMTQVNRIVGGTHTNNALRMTGNLLGGGGGLGMMLTGGAGALAAGPAGAALPAVGFGLKRLQNASTMRQAAILDEMIRSRSPLAQTMQALQQLAQRGAPSRAWQGGLLGGINAGASAGPQGLLPY